MILLCCNTRVYVAHTSFCFDSSVAFEPQLQEYLLRLSLSLDVYVYVCVCVCVCVCMCGRARVCVCVCMSWV